MLARGHGAGFCSGIEQDVPASNAAVAKRDNTRLIVSEFGFVLLQASVQVLVLLHLVLEVTANITLLKADDSIFGIEV